jgi:hypothetical protein
MASSKRPRISALSRSACARIWPASARRWLRSRSRPVACAAVASSRRPARSARSRWASARTRGSSVAVSSRVCVASARASAAASCSSLQCLLGTQRDSLVGLARDELAQSADYASLVGGLMARPSSAQIVRFGLLAGGGRSSRHYPHVVLIGQPVTVACPSGVCTGRTAADGPSYPGRWALAAFVISATVVAGSIIGITGCSSRVRCCGRTGDA